MVTIDYERSTLVLRLPYNEPCIEDIKNTIPHRARTWDPTLKAWYIGLPYFDTLTNLLIKHFDIDNIHISSAIPGSLMISNQLQGDRDEPKRN